jgi:hypothetical protein
MMRTGAVHLALVELFPGRKLRKYSSHNKPPLTSSFLAILGRSNHVFTIYGP